MEIKHNHTAHRWCVCVCHPPQQEKKESGARKKNCARFRTRTSMKVAHKARHDKCEFDKMLSLLPRKRRRFEVGNFAGQRPKTNLSDEEEKKKLSICPFTPACHTQNKITVKWKKT